MASAITNCDSVIATPDEVKANIDAQVPVDAEIEAQLSVQVREHPSGFGLERQFVHIASAAGFHLQKECVAGMFCKRKVPYVVSEQGDCRHEAICAIWIVRDIFPYPMASCSDAKETPFIEAPTKRNVGREMGIPINTGNGIALKIALKMAFGLFGCTEKDGREARNRKDEK